MEERRDAANDQVVAAMVLAKLNRMAEAQALAAPALAFHRELAARNRDDPSQRDEHAVALYAAAIAGLGDPAAELAEAAALFDRAPSEMKRSAPHALFQSLVAEERARRR